MTYTTRPTSQIVSAVDRFELADFLATDVSDPILAMVSTMATSMAVDFLQSELIQRGRVVTYQQWPASGTVTRGLSPSLSCPVADIVLPFAQVISVQAVTVYGDLTEDYTVNDTAPASIKINAPAAIGDQGSPAIVVNYTAGYGTSIEDVPKQIQCAIMTLAAFLYEHRGSCDAMDALKKSGAFSILYPYRQQAVML